MALRVLAVVGTKPRRLMLGPVLTTAVMSMGVSNNTAATLTMPPNATSLLDVALDPRRPTEAAHRDDVETRRPPRRSSRSSWLAAARGIDPLVLCVPAAFAASCAFMLPVGTPPSAIVYGSGDVQMTCMVRNGSLLNIIEIIEVVLTVAFSMTLVSMLMLS